MSLRGVVTLVVCLFPVSELILAMRGRAGKRVVRRADQGSLGMLWLTIAAGVTLAVFARALMPEARFAMPPEARDALALVLLVLGLSLRWVAIAALGRFFTVDVAIHEGHGVVRTGPYRYVRHPSYTGALTAFLGLSVSLGNWFGLLALMPGVTLAFLSRIRTEEAALMQALGAEYAAYCRTTARLIPGLY